eukprot:UN28723
MTFLSNSGRHGQLLSGADSNCGGNYHEGCYVKQSDCQGSWSSCTTTCEGAAQRTFTETQSQSGNGAPCPTASDCHRGDGPCLLDAAVWTNWGLSGSCSVSCGTGQQSRTRGCIAACHGSYGISDVVDVVSCALSECDLDCQGST